MINSLVEKAKAYVKKHPPDTGYTVRAAEAVASANLPIGTNVLVQFALQFTGKEELIDKVNWDSPERRLPYGDSRSLDGKSDCSSFVQNLFDLFFGINIGTWTEGQWSNLKNKQIQWEQRRPCDLIYYNFKDGRRVSHVALYAGDGQIIHTTSTSNPLRLEADSYGAKNRVGVVRVLSDEQYNSLIIKAPIDVYPIVTHIVKKGDTLSKIAKQYGVTLAQLKAWNPIIKSLNLIKIGWALWVSLPPSHTVVKGDNLTKISKRYGVSIAKLMELNPFIKDPNKISIGWNLKLK